MSEVDNETSASGDLPNWDCKREIGKCLVLHEKGSTKYKVNSFAFKVSLISVNSLHHDLSSCLTPNRT